MGRLAVPGNHDLVAIVVAFLRLLPANTAPCRILGEHPKYGQTSEEKMNSEVAHQRRLPKSPDRFLPGPWWEQPPWYLHEVHRDGDARGDEQGQLHPSCSPPLQPSQQGAGTAFVIDDARQCESG